MRLRSPRRREVWVHVDRLDREDGRVMAVQWRGAKGGLHYETVHKVEWHGVRYLTTIFFGKKSTRQPRLVVLIPGGVVELIDYAPNMRVVRVTTPTSSGIDRRRPGHI